MLASCRLDLDFWGLVAIQLPIQTLIKALKGLTFDLCLGNHLTSLDLCQCSLLPLLREQKSFSQVAAISTTCVSAYLRFIERDRPPKRMLLLTRCHGMKPKACLTPPGVDLTTYGMMNRLGLVDREESWSPIVLSRAYTSTKEVLWSLSPFLPPFIVPTSPFLQTLLAPHPQHSTHTLLTTVHRRLFTNLHHALLQNLLRQKRIQRPNQRPQGRTRELLLGT